MQQMLEKYSIECHKKKTHLFPIVLNQLVAFASNIGFKDEAL
jgi:hypothetical protein